MLRKRITRLFLSVVAFVFIMGLNEYAYAEKEEKEPKPDSPPTWNMQLDSTNGDAISGCGSSRFECIFPTLSNPNGAAVFDKETGLVWEQSPGTPGDRPFVWNSAIMWCFMKELDGRRGWRLPTLEELATLVDLTQSNPTLPSGHPFSNVLINHWTVTTSTIDPTWAWVVNFNNGPVFTKPKVSLHHVWCVRGGQGHDAY